MSNDPNEFCDADEHLLNANDPSLSNVPTEHQKLPAVPTVPKHPTDTVLPNTPTERPNASDQHNQRPRTLEAVGHEPHAQPDAQDDREQSDAPPNARGEPSLGRLHLRRLQAEERVSADGM